VQTKNFMGLSGFTWWFGVVENRIDPLNLGRCQVRIFGWHTDDNTLIPSNDLPWAVPMLPVNSTQLTTFKEGDMVVGFFTDGPSAQSPVIMGVIPGIPSKNTNPTQGFTDRRQGVNLKTAPRKVKSRVYRRDGTGIVIQNEEPARYPDNINEPTTSRLSRHENLFKTYLGDRAANLDTGIPLAGDRGFWNEPAPAYNAKFPYNKAYETESGHSFEVDDTPGHERINTTHRSGTFHEIYPSGTKVEKITKSNYQIIMADDNIHIMGKCNITVDSEARILVKGNAFLDVGGDLNARVVKNYNLAVGEAFNVVAKKINIQTQKEMQTSVGTDNLMTVQGKYDLTVQGKTSITSLKDFEIQSGVKIKGLAPIVDLNPGDLLSVVIAAGSAALTMGAFPQVTSAINSAADKIAGSLTSSFQSATNGILGSASQTVGTGISLQGVTGPGISLGVGTSSAFDLAFDATAIATSLPTGGLGISLSQSAGSSIGIGNIVGGSFGGVGVNLATTNASQILGSMSGGVLNDLSGTIVSKGLMDTMTNVIKSSVKDVINPQNILRSIPALITNPTSVLTQFGSNVLGNAAGATIGNAVAGTGISLGTFVDNSQISKIMSDAAKATVSSGSVTSGGISILSNSIPILSAELEKAVKEVVDDYKPTISNLFTGDNSAGAGIKISGNEWNLDVSSGEWTNSSTPGWTVADNEIFKPNVDISGGVSITADRVFRISADDSITEKLSSKSLSDIFSPSNISKVVDATISKGVDLSKTEAENYLNNYIKNINIGTILSKDALSFLPKTVNDAINSIQRNPSMMLGSVASSAAFQTTNMLRSSISSTFSALTTQKNNLIDPVTSAVAELEIPGAQTIYDSAPKALAFGLDNTFGDLIKNNSLVAEFGGSTGIFSKFNIIDNNITTVTTTIQQNISSLQKQFDIISNVPGTTYKEEIGNLISTYEKETYELLDSLEQSIQITVNDIHNTTAFIVDPTV
jgi:hypothetical protein